MRRLGPRAGPALLCLASLIVFCACSPKPPSKEAVGNPPLGQVKDGVYVGKAKAFPVKVTVEVKVAGGKMEDIKITEHFNGRGKPAEAIVPRILERQSLDVDVVAGATWSSVTILMAVADALKKGSL